MSTTTMLVAWFQIEGRSVRLAILALRSDLGLGYHKLLRDFFSLSSLKVVIGNDDIS